MKSEVYSLTIINLFKRLYNLNTKTRDLDSSEKISGGNWSANKTGIETYAT